MSIPSNLPSSSPHVPPSHPITNQLRGVMGGQVNTINLISQTAIHTNRGPQVSSSLQTTRGVMHGGTNLDPIATAPLNTLDITNGSQTVVANIQEATPVKTDARGVVLK